MTEIIHHRARDYDDDEPEPQDILGEPEVRLETTFASVVVVDHVPVTSEDRLEKLKGVIKKVFGQMGTITDDGLYIPLDEATKQTKGFAFVEFTTKEGAENAVQQLNGFKLDKAHIFDVVRFDDFKKYDDVSETYVAPVVQEYAPKDNLLSWLVEESTLKGLDQFVVRQGELTEIYWDDASVFTADDNSANAPAHKPTLVESRSGWTDSYVMWSPLGTYLTTFHKQGIQLWGGPKWTKQMRFNHPNARLVDFSPCEKYIVTFSPQFVENDDPKDPKCIIVWDVRTGAKMRGFTGANMAAGPNASPVWPALQWSHDDKYFARLGEDTISIYETPGMGLLEKQSIKVPGIKDFSWSPSQNVLAYYVPEGTSGAIPAKVVLLSIPNRKEVRQKNLFNVKDIKLHWSSEGKYLCVKVDRHSKTKKSVFVNFELFRMKEKDIPTELLEVKENVQAFAWEPKGDRFAIIHGENANRADISFYSLAEKQVKKLKTLEKRAANGLFWSPAGGCIVLAGLRNLNGVLEFFNVDDMETLGNEEHPNCTAIDWDPSGRFLATTVSHWRHQMDTGYNLYTFAGKLVYKIVKDKFCQFVWRPRPPTLLDQGKITEIKTGMPKYTKIFNQEEKKERLRVREEHRKVQDGLRNQFNKLVEEREKEYIEWRRVRLNEAYGRDLEAEEKEIKHVDEEIVELLDEEEQIV